MSLESQRSICDWAESTFGPVTDLQACAERACKEMREFQTLVDHFHRAKPRDIRKEVCDIVVTLFRFAGAAGFDLLNGVDDVMAINRLRKWLPDGKGNGQHIKEGRGA